MNQGPYEKTVLVLGDGDTALGLTQYLLENGFPVILANQGDRNLIGKTPQLAETFIESRLERLNGQVGGFDVLLSAGGKQFERRVGFLAVAYESILESFYNLTGDSVHEKLLMASKAEDLLFGKGPFPSGIKSVIILDDPHGTATTASSERLFRLALELQLKRNIKCHIVCSHVKVASRGLELIYGQVRNSGCLISKTDGKVNIDAASSGPTVRFFDDILYEELTLNADMVIVGERHLPSRELDRLCGILALEKGPEGFLQADNVLRSTSLTNRRGIVAVGPSAQPMSRWEREQSIKAASVEIHGLYEWLLHQDHPETIEYRQGNCAYCLTCYRVCPHGAVHFTNRPFFLNLACQQCGICTSACPGEALHLMEGKKDLTAGLLKDIRTTHEGRSNKSIMAFACRKSAATVLSNRDKEDNFLPPIKWSEVPCAGLVKMADILDVLSAGDAIAGVLVLACHEGNCRSGTGTLLAKNLVRSTKEMLGKIGCEQAAVEYISTAANDGVELTKKIKKFWKSLSSSETVKI